VLAPDLQALKPPIPHFPAWAGSLKLLETKDKF
jgi:hypothetical protein